MLEGMAGPNHRQPIVEAIKKRCSKGHPVNVLEIGICAGQGSRLWAETLKKHGPKDSHLWLVDPFKFYDPQDKDAVILTKQWVEYYTEGEFSDLKEAAMASIAKAEWDHGISFYEMPSDEFFKNENLPEFDVVFIDGDHSYKCASADLANSWSRLKSDGVIFLHDYQHATEPDVEPAFHDWLDSLEVKPPWKNIENMLQIEKGGVLR